MIDSLVKIESGVYEYRGVRISSHKNKGFSYQLGSVRSFPQSLKATVAEIDFQLNRTDVTVQNKKIAYKA
jgi:hypothetical protein